MECTAKTIEQDLHKTLFRHNTVCLAGIALISAASVASNLVLSWILQQVVDLATGAGNTLSLHELCLVSLLLLAGCAILTIFSSQLKPHFIKCLLQLRILIRIVFHKRVESIHSAFPEIICKYRFMLIEEMRVTYHIVMLCFIKLLCPLKGFLQVDLTFFQIIVFIEKYCHCPIQHDRIFAKGRSSIIAKKGIDELYD